ncbi:hypothetical protein D3C80_2150190 [compost metagenome]
MHHRLDIAESGRTGRFHLPFRDSHNARADRLSNKSRGTYRESDRPRLEAVERKANC